MASKVILIKPNGITRGFNTIQSAINGAVSGETVVIYNGSYNEQVTIKDGVNMFCVPGVIITSNNALGTIIDGGVQANIVLEGNPTILNTGGGNKINLTNVNSDIDESHEFTNLRIAEDLSVSGNSILSGSLSQGNKSYISGVFSHAEGLQTSASGDYSHAEGIRNNAKSYGEHVGGVYSTDYNAISTSAIHADDRLFVLGNGTSISDRKDTLRILKDGSKYLTGSIYQSGSLTITGGILFGTASNALTASYTMNGGYLSDNIIWVSATATGINQYTTISDAINNYTTGKTILLAPETFNEDVQISGSGIVLQGVDRNNTKIGNLTITGKDCSVSNLFVSGDLTILCTSSFVPFVGNTITACDVLGNVSFGTSGSINTYQIIIDNCWFKGTNKSFIINTQPNVIEWGWSPIIKNSIIRDADSEVSWHPSTGTYILTVYSGNAYFEFCPILYFTEIIYEGAAILNFNYCHIVETMAEIEFNYDGTALPAGVGHMVFNIEKSGFYYAWNKPLTMRYKTEFNLIHSHFFTNGTTINFNSVAFSRWLYVTQKVWGSTTTLGGTGLSNLAVQNCIFHMNAPEVLHTDLGNAWQATIDY